MRTFKTRECAEDFKEWPKKKGSGRLGNLHRYARFVTDEENDCRFVGQSKASWIYTRPAFG